MRPGPPCGRPRSRSPRPMARSRSKWVASSRYVSAPATGGTGADRHRSGGVRGRLRAAGVAPALRGSVRLAESRSRHRWLRRAADPERREAFPALRPRPGGAGGRPGAVRERGPHRAGARLWASGHSVVVWHGAGVYTTYFHLSRALVAEGATSASASWGGPDAPADRICTGACAWATSTSTPDPCSRSRAPIPSDAPGGAVAASGSGAGVREGG
jgi:hypothetical protein